MADAVAKSAYEKVANKTGISAYNVAVADFFNAPNIESIDLTSYLGNINDFIVTRVTDDFIVTKVEVEIQHNDGTVVEKGVATIQANGLDWKYIATVQNSNNSGDKIIIKAYDLPGNVTDDGKSL